MKDKVFAKFDLSFVKKNVNHFVPFLLTGFKSPLIWVSWQK